MQLIDTNILMSEVERGLDKMGFDANESEVVLVIVGSAIDKAEPKHIDLSEYLPDEENQ